MDERTASTSAEVVRFMMLLAEHLRPIFPHYASALLDEVQGRRMTNERWNRVAAILASLAVLPGYLLGKEEHDARNPALSAVVIAQTMASATFGGRNDVRSCLELVHYMVEDLKRDLTSEGM
jgi:hypothetical protein